MNTPSAPKAPDPMATATAQAGMNRDAAVSQNLVNMTNQVTPDGSLTYSQNGTKSYVGADGKTYSLPSYTATQTLSAPSQAIYDTNKVTEQNIANIGRDQSARVGDALAKPVDLSNDATEARLFGLGSKRLDPLYAQREDSLRTQLINQGIRPDSAAWNSEMGRLGQDRNDAYNSLLLSGRGQSVQEALAERNQPINEITALMSGSQVSQPNFVGTPQASVAAGDYAGAVSQKYAGDMAQYQAKVGQQNAMMGGLFGLAGTGAKLAFSDRRVKTDIERIGSTEGGFPLYSYRYVWGGPVHTGVMADEVEAVMPEAVTSINGIKAVDYAMVGA